MIFPGHVSAGYLASHYLHTDQRTTMLAAVFPDLVDKTGRYILRWSPSGRVPAHSLLTGALTTAAVALLTRRRQAVVGWAAGYLVHVLSDLVVDQMVGEDTSGGYALWPLTKVDIRRHPIWTSFQLYSVGVWLFEVLVTLWAVLVARRRARSRGIILGLVRGPSIPGSAGGPGPGRGPAGGRRAIRR